MCRMIGIKNYSYEKHEKILLDFAELAVKGNVPEGAKPGHADGWGMGYYRDGKAVLHRSAASLPEELDTLEEHLRLADRSPVLMVHLRKSAWPGTTAIENSHPFLWRNRLFAHNGTLYNYRDLLGQIPNGKDLEKALDTEIYFHYLLHNGDGENGICESLSRLVKKGSYSSLNCLMSDGARLYAFREYSREPGYYSLFHARCCGSDLVSSERVSPGLDWKMIRRRKLLVL